MTRKGALVAAGVVVVFNLATLAAVWSNRAGEPEAVLQLTERELSLPPREAENTALALRLEWVDPEILRPGPGWFDRQRLEEVGFDCSLPVTSENRAHYQGQAPRAVFAVLEYEGEAWRRYEAEPMIPPTPDQRYVDSRRAERDPGRRAQASHLVLVDVGRDAAALRARHPNRRREIVMPATATIRVVEEPGQPAYLEGRVAMIQPQQVNVPRDHRHLLETLQTDWRRRVTPEPGLPSTGSITPRYRATVKWGGSLEPWLADVQPSGR
ncbi:MAG: DUF4824 family protein [Acidobacteria bacterium]|nr:MAG: DUF4824 family protein [Acidobacteriota bacterium]